MGSTTNLQLHMKTIQHVSYLLLESADTGHTCVDLTEVRLILRESQGFGSEYTTVDECELIRAFACSLQI